MTEAQLARLVMRRIEELGQITDEPGRLTRTFCSPAMRRANALVGSWMRQAGMTVRQDAIGNLIGLYGIQNPKSKIQNGKVLLLGSHLDTVRDAGKFDGPLGVLTAVACVQYLRARQIHLPFSIQVIGFADEEGVRYHNPYLGSAVVAGTFARRDLKRKDPQGIAMDAAIRDFGGDPEALPSARIDSKQLLGYTEVHIEQGPILEKEGLAVGVVAAIAGQTRAQLTFIGTAGHAGTTPMKLRRDALCAAAEFVLAVEALGGRLQGLVATVGHLQTLPGVSNAIPGQVRLSLDVRHAKDPARRAAVATLRKQAQSIASRRKSKIEWSTVSETAAVECDRRLSALLNASVKRHQGRSMLLTSGAGHDAAVVAAITPVSMLFVRCKAGISHQPDESAREQDVRVAIAVMLDFIQSLARNA